MLLTFIGPWNEFLWPFLVTKETDMQPLAVSLANYISNVAGRAANPYGAILAGAVVLAAPAVALFVAFQTALHHVGHRLWGEGMRRLGIMGTGRLVGATASLAAVLTAAASGMTPAQASVDAPRMTRSATAPLTNLAHLDWLGARVAPPGQAGHTTYRLAEATAGRRPVDLRRVGRERWLPARRRRHLRPHDGHLRPGGLQRGRHGPGRGRVPAALARHRF